MSQQIPEGWYADPQRPQTPGAERWWNGYQWTAHTRIATPEEPEEPAAAPGGVPSYPSPAGTRAETSRQGSQPYGEGSQPDGEHGPQWRPHPTPPTRGSIDLPDGRRLADIGTRLGTYLIDLVIVYLVVSPFRLALGAFDPDVFPSHRFLVLFDLRDALDGISMLAVYVVYQVAFLRLKGATPGRMMAGTRVESQSESQPGSQPESQPGLEPGSPTGRPEVGGLVLRTLVLAGPFYPQAFPVLGIFGYFLPIVAIIQASNDPRRQGMHDKAAHTVVVSRPR